MGIFTYLLLPFSWLYALATDIRNHLYNIGLRKSVHFDLPIISVGNLRVGGTGKTPHTEYLIRLLKPTHKIATLSRGYGRKTKGFLLANDQCSAWHIGDESWQYYLKFKPDIQVSVGEERITAIPQILAEHPDTQVVILDDAFQHRAIKPTLQILLTDYQNPFYQDLPLPAGRLRERRKGAKRADIIIVSKCPTNLNTAQKEQIKQQIYRYATLNAPIFFTSIAYSPLVSFGKKSTEQITKLTQIVLVSAIAQPQSIELYIQQAYTLKRHFCYPDHHYFSTQELAQIADYYNSLPTQDKILVCTEKDFAKLQSPKNQHFWENICAYYQPIEIYFLEKVQEFNEIILKNCIFVKS